MKKLILMAVIGSLAFTAISEVTITNLVVAQRPGTKLVDITYDVSSTATNAVTVLLVVSNGTSAVACPSVSGAVGASVETGTAKSMVWNMGADWNENVANLSFTVQVDDLIARCAVAQTGQTISYRTGDDGDLETGVAWPNPRFADLDDGTVKDNLTGLEWVRAPHSLSGNSSEMVWNSAVDFCNNLVYAGHSDWRLPSVKELESLVSCGVYYPVLPIGHLFSGVESADYWSGTSQATSPTDRVMKVNMYFGTISDCYKTYLNYVLPVRSKPAEAVSSVPQTGQATSYRTGDDGDLETGAAWPNPRFTDFGDGTVKDNLTGLEWVRAPHAISGNSGTMVWNSAVDFCRRLVYAGHSDWRLPSRKELLSLVDYGQHSPALPAENPFVGVQSEFSGCYWSGTTGAYDTGSAWYVEMKRGLGGGYYKTYSQYVWPVRGGR